MEIKSRNLRLLMPQWQGGGNPAYQLGARLLAWLAPSNDDPIVEVPVAAPSAAMPGIEDGIYAKSDLLRQTRAARDLLEFHDPDRIVTFGGDCSVSLAPFSFLAEKYKGDIAALWIDAHTDFTTSEHYGYAHGYPALNLLGAGDSEFAEFAKTPIPGANLIYVGVGKKELGAERLKSVEASGATVFDPSELSTDFDEVIARLRRTGANKIVVHFDVDALDPQRFRSQLFSHPDGYLAEQFSGIATGKLTLDQVVKLLHRVGGVCEVVGLTFAEHLPWDALHMRQAMSQMPILSNACNPNCATGNIEVFK